MVSGVVLTGGTNRLRLVPGGKEYVPGDTVPVTAAQLRSLKAMGLRFEGTLPVEIAQVAEPAQEALLPPVAADAGGKLDPSAEHEAPASGIEMTPVEGDTLIVTEEPLSKRSRKP